MLSEVEVAKVVFTGNNSIIVVGRDGQEYRPDQVQGGQVLMSMPEQEAFRIAAEKYPAAAIFGSAGTAYGVV